ncbi:PrsW family intramembrane metalloprotease [Streptoalloteichus hindustanus]|uniref:Membrane proteinase PrsW, cleaves anti-sigma factor RsiW, M82 family n=1 Tax=Streptoalloteichus hindustanus TaxID=2017 RepID=A0A1M5PBZ5_STRHI|nr:PrsW family glutamic-type intramembrane protease [Streptoalloteichus hindustanus]SHG99351.1 Membrane proteinase PrsW, cleaves anti-sigma factor RsiW, M82 family [Streptoalloteichus hindustanus]
MSAYGAGASPPIPPPTTPAQPRAWLTIFTAGLALWVLTVLVTLLTGNTNLVPTLVLLGSFLLPVTYVAWAFAHGGGGELTLPVVAQAFFVGGVLGVLAASLLETYLLAPSPWMYVGVGLIEELVKLLALAYVARHLRRRSLRDGLVLGASVGFGFAAFESAGYALNALITVRGLDLRALVETEILRGLLAPVGHGLWTAIAGGVLFAASGAGRWRITAGVAWTYLAVAALHALWDSMHGIAVLLTMVLTGTSYQYRLLQLGYLPRPSPAQVHLFTLLNWIGLVVVALVGLAWLVALRRAAELPPPPPPVPPTGPGGPAGPGTAPIA